MRMLFISHSSAWIDAFSEFGLSSLIWWLFIFSDIRIQNTITSGRCLKPTRRWATMRYRTSISSRQQTFACQIIASKRTMTAAGAASVAAWCLARTANRGDWHRADDAIYPNTSGHSHDIYQSCQPIWICGFISKALAIRLHCVPMSPSIHSAVVGMCTYTRVATSVTLLAWL